MSRWSDFYKARINTTYQDYFEKKYGVLLEILSGCNSVREEGIGIGSVSKYLLKRGIDTSGFDLCPEMLNLCRSNNPNIKCQEGDIFTFNEGNVDMVVTHGVLEHFSDCDILKILDRYKRSNQKSVHYVPLDGYVIPSFGDERLLSYQYWVDKFKPSDFVVNDNKDLYLIFN